MNWLIQGKWIAGGFGLTLLLIGMISFTSYRKILALREQANVVETTYEIIDNLTNLYTNMTIAESGRRGYIVTGSQQELERHLQAIASMKSDLQLLQKRLQQVSLSEQEKVKQLATLVSQRIFLFQQSIKRYRPDSIDDKTQQKNTSKSVVIREKFQILIVQLKAEQKRILHNTIAKSRDNIRENILLLLLGACASFAIILSGYYLVYFQEQQRKKIEKDQQSLLQDKELSDLKIRLFSMISHEFRTPLTVIFSSSHLLEDSLEEIDRSGRKNLYRIQLSVKLMNQFLTDILILTRAEAGNINCNLEPLDIEAFCLNLVENIYFLNTNNIPIKLISEGFFVRPHLDEKLLYSILSNLLLNAIKYSRQKDNIILELKKENNMIIFQVKDNGIGILLEDQQHIYEPFYRGKNVENIIGTGLGLAVVKKCVELHQGEITLESELGKGTIFTIKLPMSDRRQ